MSPRTALQVADLVEQLHAVTGGQVLATVVPRTWDNKHAERLGRCIVKILAGGGVALYAVECCLQALDFDREQSGG